MPASQLASLARCLRRRRRCCDSRASAQTPLSTAQIERGRYLVARRRLRVVPHRRGRQAVRRRARRSRRRSARSTRTNITPDTRHRHRQLVEGRFLQRDARGIDDDGKHLYPAFPYPWFTKVSRARRRRDQGLSRHACRRSSSRTSRTELPWPLSWRGVMAGWNVLYFRRRRVPSRSEEIGANGTAARTWSKGSAIAAPATRRRTSLGAHRRRGEALQGGMPASTGSRPA